MSHKSIYYVRGVVLPPKRLFMPGTSFMLDFYGIDIKGTARNMRACLEASSFIDDISGDISDLLKPVYLEQEGGEYNLLQNYHEVKKPIDLDSKTQGLFAELSGASQREIFIARLVDYLMGNSLKKDKIPLKTIA